MSEQRALRLVAGMVGGGDGADIGKTHRHAMRLDDQYVLAAGVFGPWLLRSEFGAEYLADGALLAWLTAAAVAIALLTLTGAATVAATQHQAYSVGWVSATVASALLLLLPVSLETRTVIALLCGPLAGIAVHLVALAREPAS